MAELRAAPDRRGCSSDRLPNQGVAPGDRSATMRGRSTNRERADPGTPPGLSRPVPRRICARAHARIHYPDLVSEYPSDEGPYTQFAKRHLIGISTHGLHDSVPFKRVSGCFDGDRQRAAADPFSRAAARRLPLPRLRKRRRLHRPMRPDPQPYRAGGGPSRSGLRYYEAEVRPRGTWRSCSTQRSPVECPPEAVGRTGWTRTNDPLLRRQMLYPPELRSHVFMSVSQGSGRESRSRKER